MLNLPTEDWPKTLIYCCKVHAGSSPEGSLEMYIQNHKNVYYSLTQQFYL